MKLSIRDNAFGHSPISNSPTIPLEGVVSPMEWDRASWPTPETIYTDECIPFAPAGRGGIAWTIEPSRPEIYKYVRETADVWRSIWTADRELLAALPNAHFLTNAGCWIAPGDRRLWRKSKSISTVASHKRGGEGYDMRHEAIRRFPWIDAYGPEYTPLPGVHQQDKIAALRDYRFHLCIENTRRDYFFSEKLIDCFMTGTVPVYWGCPSIGNFFNPYGMIQIRDLSEVGIAKALGRFSEKAYYCTEVQDAVFDNFERAKRFCLTEDYIAKNLL